MPLTPEQLTELQAINTSVNAIPYDSFPSKAEPTELWTDVIIPGDSWVCRDYVQAKADRLKIAGWSPAFLTTVLCWTEDIPPREYHAVLAVSMSGEIWILDSRIDKIYPSSNPPFDYRWDKQQVPGTDGFRDVSETGGLAEPA